MSELSVERLVARQGEFTLGPVDLTVPEGRALAVIGPSGSGKTTLLRALSGFVPLAGGRLSIDGGDLARLAPEQRGIGYVPQGLALFPHRSVRGNLEYPLEIRGRSDGAERVEDLAKSWGLSSLLDARPGEISGGEQQKVAMARALASEPRVLLWDEPLSAVDALARSQLIDLVRQELERVRIPMVLVTHDAETAFSVADRFLVLDHGAARFYENSEALEAHPQNAFVARFAGYENVLGPEELGRLKANGPAEELIARSGRDGVCFPADAVVIMTASEPGWTASVLRIRRSPSFVRLQLETAGVSLSMVLSSSSPLPPAVGVGAPVKVRVRAEAVRPVGPGKMD
ncbi:MAG: ABC transporter ATP-binding protein [Thermoplasmata archaeon]|nr:ABC transporter ATP-binding protein [Thermoplasmata archaeon]